MLSELRFNNGQQALGFIAVSEPDDQVYLVAIADNSGSFIDLPLNRYLHNLVNIRRLEKEFNVSLDNIFPIEYSTMDYPILGRQYNGMVENKY